MRDAVTTLTLSQRQDNLPAEATRFIGRRRELPVLAAAIEHHRLVTLRGAGGVGKTRLALRAAHDARDEFADGCALVELSALRTPELLARTVSGALGLPGEAPGDALDVLAASVAERELLLILDSCEHLVDACAALVRVLLDAAPGLRVLATSRESLGLPDEHALLITPLDLPADDAQAMYGDAVTLFADRARAAVGDVAFTPRLAAATVKLCRRLDGIPLALELAAVRLRDMPLGEILARVSDRFRILGSHIGGAGRTVTDTHRTLRAAVAWSYELCTPAEQRLWAELSVFPGSFGPDAVEYVCGPGSPETLTRLAEKSVVRLSASPARYHLPAPLREFGMELLDSGRLGTGPQAGAERLRRRHRDYYLRLARQAHGGSLTAAQPSWLSALRAETGNLRVALGYSFHAPGQQRAGLLMTTLLRPYWLMAGECAEGRWWHHLAAATDPGSAENADAVYGAGLLAVRQGDLTAGVPLLEAAAAAAARLGDEDLAAHVRQGRGLAALHAGDPRTAMAELEAALAAYRRRGFSDPQALACYPGLAAACLLTGELDRAATLTQECLRRCDELGERWARGAALWVRGAVRWLSGDLPAAIEDARACLRINGPGGGPRLIAMSLDLLAGCLAAAGEFERAAVLYGAGGALWTPLNGPVLMGPAYAPFRGRGAEGARRQLGAERFAALASRGHALPLPAVIAIAAGEAPGVPDSGAALDGTPDLALTRREREIAGLVAAGLANREIAKRLYLSKRTVDSHLEHIFTKLGFSARTQLVGWVRARP
jgi:predicted ATPase/DNA-binding CsgD family transcriptional regulator